MRTKVRRTWQQLGTRRAQLAAWLTWVVVVVVLLVRSEDAAANAADAARDARSAVAAFQAAEHMDDAEACVNSWEGRLGVRALIDGLVAASSADPARVAAFREDMARRLPDPECDLEAARRTLTEFGS